MGGTVFISYSREDADYVAALVAHLAAHGIATWHDEAISAGAVWTPEIESRIDICAVFVV